jgi:hypothetical protein
MLFPLFNILKNISKKLEREREKKHFNFNLDFHLGMDKSLALFNLSGAS